MQLDVNIHINNSGLQYTTQSVINWHIFLLYWNKMNASFRDRSCLMHFFFMQGKFLKGLLAEKLRKYQIFGCETKNCIREPITYLKYTFMLLMFFFFFAFVFNEKQKCTFRRIYIINMFGMVTRNSFFLTHTTNTVEKCSYLYRDHIFVVHRSVFLRRLSIRG